MTRTSYNDDEIIAGALVAGHLQATSTTYSYSLADKVQVSVPTPGSTHYVFSRIEVTRTGRTDGTTVVSARAWGHRCTLQGYPDYRRKATWVDLPVPVADMLASDLAI